MNQKALKSELEAFSKGSQTSLAYCQDQTLVGGSPETPREGPEIKTGGPEIRTQGLWLCQLGLARRK